MLYKRNFIRESGVKDAKLIVIAAEGTKTEQQYFKGLAARFRNPRVHVEVLERIRTASSPDHVIKQLDGFKEMYHLEATDDLWMAIDFDRWGSKKLSDIATRCIQKSYRLAVSNPCLELWLLLHLKDLDEYKQKKIVLFSKNENSALEKGLRRMLGSYNKKRLDVEKFSPFVNDAIARAKKLDKRPSHRWPQQIGTRVYLLVEEIISA